MAPGGFPQPARAGMAWLAYVLAAIAGIVDVAGYIALGGIFTAHVSGDTVTAAVAAAHRDWIHALERLAPVFLLVVGYIAGGALIKIATMHRLPYWFSLGASVEVLLLAVFALAHRHLAGSSLSYVPDRWALLGLMSCLTLAMGVQNALLRNVGDVAVRTTFVTGMVVGFANALLDWIFAHVLRSPSGKQREEARVYAIVWASFAAGGCAGGYLQVIHGAIIFLIPCFAMAGLAIYALRFPAAHVEPGV
jgi:uncharacterized membrane protein YoaK (UPF0700 family)